MTLGPETNMKYVILALGQSASVLLLGAVGIFLGRWFSRLRSRAWLLGYCVPVLLVAIIALPRWMPRLEQLVPFRWIMANRAEFAAMALICTTLLTTPLCRLKLRRQRIAVTFFMSTLTGLFCILSLLPFTSSQV